MFRVQNKAPLTVCQCWQHGFCLGSNFEELFYAFACSNSLVMSGRSSSTFLQTESYCTLGMYLHDRPMSRMKCENIAVTQF